MPLEIEDNLHECCFGDAEGYTMDEIGAKWPQLMHDVLYPTPTTWDSKYPGADAESKQQDKQMIVALVRAFGWQHKLERGNLNIQELAQLEQMDRSYMGKIIRLTCLAPDIVESILAGLQPRDLTLKDLIRNTIPVDWNEQRKMFGFRQE